MCFSSRSKRIACGALSALLDKNFVHPPTEPCLVTSGGNVQGKCEQEHKMSLRRGQVSYSVLCTGIIVGLSQPQISPHVLPLLHPSLSPTAPLSMQQSKSFFFFPPFFVVPVPPHSVHRCSSLYFGPITTHSSIRSNSPATCACGCRVEIN